MIGALRLAATIAVMAPSAIALAADPGVTDTEVVIGAVAPFTGPAGPTAYAGILGLRIATGEINDAGGINGRKIRFVAEDDNYVPARTVQAMQKLIDVDKIFALTAGSGGAHYLAILPMLEEQGIPSINPFVAGMSLYDPVRRTVFGIGMSYRDGAFELMKDLATRYPGTKWASVVQDDESGIEPETGYKRAVAELKLTSVLELRHKRGQTDFSSEVLRIREAGATGIFLGTVAPTSSNVIKEARKLGLKMVFATSWLARIPQVFDLFGEAGDGVVVYDFVPGFEGPTAAPIKELAKKYIEASDLEKMNTYTMLGYVTMRLMSDAMRRCGKALTRECTIAQLEATRDYSTGFMSPITFSANSHLTKLSGEPLIIDFANKRFVPLK